MREQPPAYGQHGLWRDAANFDEERARQLAFDNLELRGRSPDEIAAREAYLDLLGIGPDQQVLEVGCGSAVVVRDIARRVGAVRDRDRHRPIRVAARDRARAR